MGIVAWTLAGLALGAVVQAVCARRDRRRVAPLGRIVDGLHVHRIGDAGPVVVFEAGLAATCLNWLLVQRALAAHARTCSYDRAGLGWSMPVRGDRTLRRWTDDLHRLIHMLDLPRPLVLTGHSFGTYIVRVYAHRFPDDVSALVLVDPITPEEFSHPSLRTRLRLWRAAFFAYVASALAACGLVRLGLWGLLRRGRGNPGLVLGLHRTPRRVAAEIAKLPREVIPAVRARWSEPRFYRELAASIRALPGCATEALQQPVPPQIPVVVLSGSHQEPAQRVAQAAVATQHVIVQGSAHWIHLDQPSLVAQVVLDAARRAR